MTLCMFSFLKLESHMAHTYTHFHIVHHILYIIQLIFIYAKYLKQLSHRVEVLNSLNKHATADQLPVLSYGLPGPSKKLEVFFRQTPFTLKISHRLSCQHAPPDYLLGVYSARIWPHEGTPFDNVELFTLRVKMILSRFKIIKALINRAYVAPLKSALAKCHILCTSTRTNGDSSWSRHPKQLPSPSLEYFLKKHSYSRFLCTPIYIEHGSFSPQNSPVTSARELYWSRSVHR